jgi:hypothetical protein
MQVKVSSNCSCKALGEEGPKYFGEHKIFIEIIPIKIMD